MSEATAEATATEAEAQEQQTEPQEQPKPSETVDFWKQKAREQEKRAKENAEAAKRLGEIEESQKSESQKAADRVAKAEAEVASVPSKVADALRSHLVDLHKIDKDDAELFLTAGEPELLLKQVSRLLAQSDDRAKNNNIVPSEGNNTRPDEKNEAAFARSLFAPSVD